MKIYEIHKHGEKEWVAANTIIEALQEYCSTTGTDLIDFDAEDDVIEIPESQWDEYTMRDEEDGIIKTFRQVMEETSTPEIIAGTPYL